MAFDFKKEFKEFYQPSTKPSIIEIPNMKFIAVRGTGDPNEEAGEYQEAIAQLYGVAYTLRMSYKGERQIEGYYQYVVPPLEGFWWQEGVKGVDYSKMENFQFISLIRLPEFITEEDVEWAKETVAKKKKDDFSKVQYFEYEEGIVVQCMHIGPYREEQRTVQLMNDFIEDEGYTTDFSDDRYHHEIYISDPRRSKPENLKTVLRHPVRKKD